MTGKVKAYFNFVPVINKRMSNLKRISIVLLSIFGSLVVKAQINPVTWTFSSKKITLLLELKKWRIGIQYLFKIGMASHDLVLSVKSPIPGDIFL